MLSIEDPTDTDFDKFKRDMTIIALIKKYNWLIPTNYIKELNITENEIAYFRGGLLTPRKNIS